MHDVVLGRTESLEKQVLALPGFSANILPLSSFRMERNMVHVLARGRATDASPGYGRRYGIDPGSAALSTARERVMMTSGGGL